MWKVWLCSCWSYNKLIIWFCSASIVVRFWFVVSSIPEFDRAIPWARCYLWRLNWVPININGHTSFMNRHCSVIFACLPVPKPQLSFGVSRAQELAIWWELQAASVPWIQVARELLLPVQLEVPLAVVYHNFVIHALSGKIFPIRMHGGCRNGMHVGLTDVLGNNRDAELPHVDLLVVSCRDEPSSILNEGYRVDRAQVLLILLHNFLWVGIELQDLFVRATCQKDVLSVVARVEFDAEGSALVCKWPDYFPCFGIP